MCRVEVIYELPEHELTCAYGYPKHVLREETNEKMDIVPMLFRVIKHIRNVTVAEVAKQHRSRLPNGLS